MYTGNELMPASLCRRVLARILDWVIYLVLGFFVMGFPLLGDRVTFTEIRSARWAAIGLAVLIFLAIDALLSEFDRPILNLFRRSNIIGRAIVRFLWKWFVRLIVLAATTIFLSGRMVDALHISRDEGADAMAALLTFVTYVSLLMVLNDVIRTQRCGKTWGKSVLRIQVVDATEDRLPSRQQCLKRATILWVYFFIPIVAIYITFLAISDLSRVWHDRVASTRVVRA